MRLKKRLSAALAAVRMKNMDDLTAKRIYSMIYAEIRNRETMRKTNDTDEYWKEHDLEPPVKLTEEQLKQVNDFWGKYSFAYQNDPRVQEYFSYISGRFDPRYCAEGLNEYYMFRFYDSPDYHTAFHNKNYRECLFGKENCSEALLRRIKGIWYDGDYNVIGLGGAINAAAKYLRNHEKLIVKPIPGGGGEGILFLRKGDSEKSISDTFANFTRDDLIIEKIIKPHESYVLEGGSSVNTLRIITFLYNQEVTVLAILFRMGCKGTEVDNFRQGGIACGVYADGTCMDYGFDDSGRRYDVHPDGFQFAGHKLYGVDKAVEFVKKFHFKIPMFKQMSWDVVITEEGRPILVEMNPRGDAKIYQSVGALPFGEYTEQVLDEYLLLSFYKLGATRSWDYKEYCDHITLTGYGLDEEFVTVPASINGKTVTAMDQNCFQDKHPRKIVIPGCVKESSSLIIPEGAEVVWEEDKRGIVVLPPADLKAVYVDDHVELTWSSAPDSDNEVSRVTSYRIFRMEIGEARTHISTVAASANSFRDFSVRPDTTYLYWIRSHSAACNLTSDFTPDLGARVDTTVNADDQIANLKAAPSKNSVKLTWRKNTAAAYYKVFVWNNDTLKGLAKTTSNAAVSFIASDLTADTYYKFRVTAYNSSDTAIAFRDITVKTNEKIANLKAAPEKNSVKLTWNKNTAAAYYKIFVWDNDTLKALAKTTSNTAVAFNASDLTANTSYKFRVTAYNSSDTVIAFSDITTKTAT